MSSGARASEGRAAAPRRFGWRACVGLLLLATYAAVLSWNLAADLPGDLDQSVGIVFDPPSKNHNARNRVLWGTWVVDEWTPVVHSPLHTWAQAWIFRFAGVGLAQARLLDVAASTASLALLFLLARLCLSPGWAALATLGAATSYPLLIYGRSGLLEPLVLVFGLLTVYLLSLGYRAAAGGQGAGSRRFFAAAGLAAGLSFLAKATAWPYVLAVLLVVLLRPPARRGALPALLAGLLPVALWYGLVFVPAWSGHFRREADFWAERAQSAPLIVRWLRQNLFDQAAEFRHLLALGVAVAPLAFAGTGEPATRARRVPLLAGAIVFLLGSQFLAVINYRPFRYGIPYLPLTYLLAAWGLSRLQRACPAGSGEPGPSPLVRLALVVSVSYAAFFGLASVRSGWVGPLARPGTPVRLLLLTAAVAALVLLAPRWLPRVRPRVAALRRSLPAWVALVPAAALFAPCIAVGLERYREWASSPEFTMRDFSRRLGSDYREMVVGGTSPLFAVMENRHRAVKITSYDLNHRWLAERRLTHLLLPKGQGQAFRKDFPGVLDAAVEIARPIIGGHLHVLYATRLEPVRAVRGPSGSVRLVNADAHSPQTVAVLSGQPGMGGGGDSSLTLLPGEERLLPPGAAAGRRIVDLRLLREAAQDTAADLPPPAFDAASPVFRSVRWDGAAPVAISREGGGAPALLLLHVRAAQGAGGPARFVLRAGAGAGAGAAGAAVPAALSPSRHAAVVVPLDATASRWTLEVQPPQPLWVDLLAAVRPGEWEKATLAAGPAGSAPPDGAPADPMAP